MVYLACSWISLNKFLLVQCVYAIEVLGKFYSFYLLIWKINVIKLPVLILSAAREEYLDSFIKFQTIFLNFLLRAVSMRLASSASRGIFEIFKKQRLMWDTYKNVIGFTLINFSFCSFCEYYIIMLTSINNT